MLIACMFRAAAQQAGSSNADWQLWPETSLSIALNERVSLLAFGALHFGKDFSDLNEEQIGGGLNFSFNKYFSFSPAYRYIKGQPPGRSHVREHRGSLDFNARMPLGEKFQLSERNRVELRRIDGIISGRYRNRLQVERQFRVHEHKVIPYLADEVFYDGRFHIWNRNRIYAGVRVPLNKHFSMDPYYLDQHDVRDRPFTRRHVIALSLRIDY